MKKILLSSVATIALCSGSAFAADVPARGPVYKAAPAAAVFDWSGFYIGGHLGYSSRSFFSSISDPVQGTQKAKGFTGGGQLGYNIQSGNIVWGLEGDLSATNRKFAKVDAASDVTFKTSSLASIRGRLGIAFDRILVYGTGGFGFVSGKVYTSPGISPVKFHKTKPVLGGGIEWAATNNITYRVEALDFIGSTKSLPDVTDVDGNQLKNVWEVRFGVNYKFDGSGWGKGPVYAKY
jgi:outer membrane immunogenic protein